MAVKRGTNLSDVLGGTSGDDTIYGYGGHDSISGLAGNDSVFGGAGDDDLIGGTGVNDYWGGSGYDWFIMSQRTTAGFSDDVIYDFTFDVDQIDVSTWGVRELVLVFGTAG